MKRVLRAKLFKEDYVNMRASGCAKECSDMREFAKAMAAFWIEIVFGEYNSDEYGKHAPLDYALRM